MSSAKTQTQIARLEQVSYSPVHPIQTWLIADTVMPMRNDFINDDLSGHSRDRRFARSINICHDHVVRIIERATKFLSQCLGARITVRLKQGEHTLAPDRSRRSERG